jgi:competence protein ComEC
MRLSDYPFLKYLPFLIFGILIGERNWIDAPLSWVMVLSLWGIYSWIRFTYRNFPVRFSFMPYLILIFLGIHLGQSKSKIQVYGSEELLEVDSYLAKVRRFDVPKPNSSENLLELFAIKDSVGWRSSQASILVYHRADSSLLPGQLLWITQSPDTIPSPIFPNEFDYRDFLARNGIHHRQFLGKDAQTLEISEDSSLEFLLPKIRRNLLARIDSSVSFQTSKQIAAALLLGEKNSLDREIREAYAATGTMHILAVSGLHVGIIYAILFFPLRYLRLSSGKKKIYLTGIILLIWCYALLTGFSPSVVRAATMFSFFTIGDMRMRKPSSWNLLGLSAIVMLVFDPDAYREVGFQLSYLAVAGILALQPLIVRWWLPPNRFLEYFWQLSAVSIAAQLATFPLSVFYFHLFPVYFLLANLIVIPLSFLAMMTGIGLLLLGWIPGLDLVLGFLVNWIIFAQNWLTDFIWALPGGNLDRLTISISGMLMVWVVLIGWANWDLGNRKWVLLMVVGMFFFWTGDRIIQAYQRPVEKWLVFSSPRGSLLELRLGRRTLVWNENFPLEQIAFGIDPSRLADGVEKLPQNIHAIPDQEFLWIPGWEVRFSPKTWEFDLPPNSPIEIIRYGHPPSIDSEKPDKRRF